MRLKETGAGEERKGEERRGSSLPLLFLYSVEWIGGLGRHIII
jgi:hypothetical protein